MPSTEADAAAHATSSTDFYDLLQVPTTEATPSTLRKAFRKQSLRWHPDKNADPSAAETFHLLTIAYDVLSDPATRAAYDAARAARNARKRRAEAFDLGRRRMQEDLEGRERAGKRARTEEDQAEEAFRAQMDRLRREGAELRRRREEAAKAAAEEEEEEQEQEQEGTRFTELDRTLKVRWKRREEMTRGALEQLFSRFGRVQDVVVVAAAPAKEGEEEKKKKEKRYQTALVVFESIVAAHAAVCEARQGTLLSAFKDVAWAAGREPDLSRESAAAAAEQAQKKKGPEKRFASFGGGGPSAAAAAAQGGTDYESITLMRMRAAEKARIEEEIRRADEEEGEGEA